MTAGGVLLLFPGQGSQTLGMGHHLWETYPEAREVFAQAEEYLGWDLRGLCMHGPLEELTRTDRAQPAIFVTGVATWRVLQKRRVTAEVALGHSLGEYTALVAAGHLSFADALRVVAARGLAMQRCGEEQAGTMAAIIGLSDEAIESLCREIGGVWPANYNSPGQVVVSGTPEGVAEAMAKATERGARRVLPLQVSGAFHSPLVAGAAEELRRVLESVEITPGDSSGRDPEAGGGGRPRFFSSTEVRYPQAGELKKVLPAQLTSPVRFSQSLEAVLSETTAGVECGPGGVLAGLVKRVSRRFPVYLTEDAPALQEALHRLGSGPSA
ncbi:MAG: ACP S-malonyltransferase [Thermoleophilia bacterium]